MDESKINRPSVIKRIKESYDNGYSPMILICGKMRVGKTTKAYIFAQWLSWLIFNHEWDWKNNTIVSMEQFIEKLDSTDPEILVMDEVQRMLEKKDYMRSESRLFFKLTSSQAYKHYIIFLILPKASSLGTDHAVNINYVIPCHNRKLVYPYRVESNIWDISLSRNKLPKFPLSHFELDVKSKPIKEAFKEELTHLDEYKLFIQKNLKEKIINDAKDQNSNKIREIDIPEPIIIREY